MINQAEDRTLRIAHEVQSRKQIWHCATPKSASTYLHHILTALWNDDCAQGSPVPHYGDRMQEPDIQSVFRHVAENNKTYYSGHIHLRYTKYFWRFFLKRQNILRGGAIVQHRDIKDTIVSLKDHIDKDCSSDKKILHPWFVTTGYIWQELTDVQKYKLITSFYAYWHIDFMNSWITCPRAFHVSFEQVTQDTVKTVTEICRYFEIDKTAREINAAFMKVNGYSKESKLLNIGQSGRGKALIPPAIQLLIDDLLMFANKAKNLP